MIIAVAAAPASPPVINTESRNKLKMRRDGGAREGRQRIQPQTDGVPHRQVPTYSNRAGAEAKHPTRSEWMTGLVSELPSGCLSNSQVHVEQ